jgi:O-antigen ligase
MESTEVRNQGLFAGLLLYIVFEYIRFGEWIPALQPLHLQRLIALITLIGFIFFYKGTIRHPRVMLSILAVTVLSSVFNSGNLWITGAQRFFLAMVKLTVLYYLLINLLAETSHFKKFLTVFLASNIVLILAGLLQGGYKGALSEGIFAAGFVSDSNDYALAVNVVLPFYWYFFVHEENPLRRSLFCAAFLMSLVAVIYSFSRGGFLGLCAALLYAIMKSKQRIKYILICFLALGITATFAPPSYWDKIHTIFSGEKSDDGRSSSEMRLDLWKIGIAMVEDNPLFGVGPGNFPFKITQYGAEIVPNENDLLFLSDRATHNTFINIASELGMIGLFLFMALIVKAYRDATLSERILQELPLNGNAWLQGLPPAIETSIVSYCVTSFFLTSYVYPHIYILSGMALALRGYCTARRHKDA